uniref:Uncharacterized protein n=1 Tax=Acrobeloides nanus TaxID=290746 RepID=A0A914BX55_9BILA
MEEKFNEQFSKLMVNKKKILIPNADKYEETVATIKKCMGNKRKKKISKKESNIVRCYSVRIENPKTVLYQQGESNKEAPQKVVKKEELFNLLKSEHVELRHADRDLINDE